ncbi:MAG: hypothetical protein R2798_11575 [Chitinophagales bacterium]|nr:hypothetical protein [Chitinophagales bacterium]
MKSSITELKPIADVYIRIKGETLGLEMVDSVGFFKFENLEPNKIYTLEVTALGYPNKTFEIKTNEGVTETTLTIEATCEYNEAKAAADWKRGKAKLLLIGSIAPVTNSSADYTFQQKYKIKYYDFGCTPPTDECIKLYNQQIFDLMDKKYGKVWRKEVRIDVPYLYQTTN